MPAASPVHPPTHATPSCPRKRPAKGGEGAQRRGKRISDSACSLPARAALACGIECFRPVWALAWVGLPTVSVPAGREGETPHRVAKFPGTGPSRRDWDVEERVPFVPVSHFELPDGLI